MQNTPSNSNKRKLVDTSPESQEAIQRAMEASDLIQLIKDTINANLDEKLKILPTKADLEEIKTEINTVNTDVIALKLENQNLKEELIKVKKENDDNKKDIIWLENQIRPNKLFIKGLKTSKTPFKEVESMFNEQLKININILGVRKVFDRKEKMAVIVELASAKAIEEVFKNFLLNEI